MNFAQAMMEMFDESSSRKVVICDSIIKMSEEREPNFGTEIIGYAKLKTKGVCRITVDTCGETWGKFRICDILCFDDMDMADDTWKVVTIKERRDEILRRYPRDVNQHRDVWSISDERQERMERMRRQIVSLEEVQAAIVNMLRKVDMELDYERALSARMGDPIFYSDDYDPEIDEPIPVGTKVRMARIEVLEEIVASSEFEALTDISYRISGMEAEV